MILLICVKINTNSTNQFDTSDREENKQNQPLKTAYTAENDTPIRGKKYLNTDHAKMKTKRMKKKKNAYDKTDTISSLGTKIPLKTRNQNQQHQHPRCKSH